MDENAQFYTKFNDQKVFLNGSVNQSVASSGGPPPVPTVTTVLHSLNKISSGRFWFSVAGGPKFIAPNAEAESSILVQVYITTTSINFSSINSTGSPINVTLYYRLYYDD